MASQVTALGVTIRHKASSRSFRFLGSPAWWVVDLARGMLPDLAADFQVIGSWGYRCRRREEIRILDKR